MSGDKLREAEQTVEKADKAALKIAVKYERSPDFENSEDLKRAVRVLRVPDEAYKRILQTGQHPLPMSGPSDIFAAWPGWCTDCHCYVQNLLQKGFDHVAECCRGHGWRVDIRYRSAGHAQPPSGGLLHQLAFVLRQ